ncbi:zinc finger protein 862-like [Eriocheir sinensis]|uniref:zinc finger protein 862-like n=2 Tax=Eriocheir sinensis TaxID=95602 RepID=UPI0021C6B786|nr:zinc finger protein 862-like [Eriocheir sinensis]XP_050686988.1 zinc finger protein 862-like [Eriocheir sinensis]
MESDQEKPVSKKKKLTEKSYSQAFREEWLKLPDYMPWLRKLDNNKAQCSVCKTFLQSKKSVIDLHAKGDKHKRLMKEKNDPKVIPMTSFVKAKKENDDEIINRAEIKLAAWAAEHEISFRAMDHLPAVLASSFSDSKTASKVKLKRTKTASVIYNVIGQRFLEKMKSELNDESDMGQTKFSMIMDESTDLTAEKQLAIVVKYFCKTVLCTRLLALVPVAEGDAKTLFSALENELTASDLKFENCIGWSADTCSVMHGTHDSVSSRLRNANSNMIIMKCACHSAALVASYACGVLPRSCEKLVHDVYNFFAHSCKRTSHFHEFQDFTNTDPHKLLKPCQTRWLSLKECVSRLLEQWDALLLFMQHHDLVERNLQAHDIANIMVNPFTKMYLEFLNFVLPKIVSFNVMFQSSSPMIHLLHDSLAKLYLDLLSCYVKPAYLKQSKHDISLIDPESELAMVPLESVYVGTNVSRLLTTASPKVTVEAKREFLNVCRKFLVIACKQLKQRFNFHDPVLVAASKLSVATVKSGNIASFVGNIMIHFPGILKNGKEQEVDDQWRSLPYDDNLTDDMEFEVFWKAVMQDTKYNALSYCIKAILTIPVANADCERIFSEIHRLKSPVRNRLTSSSLLKYVAAREGIGRESENCEKFEPDKLMLKKMNSKMYEK